MSFVVIFLKKPEGGINGLIYVTNKWMPCQIGIEKPIHSITHNYISIKLKILNHVYTIQTWRTAPPTPKPITSPSLLWAPELHRAAGAAALDLRFVLLWFSISPTFGFRDFDGFGIIFWISICLYWYGFCWFGMDFSFIFLVFSWVLIRLLSGRFKP